MNSENGHSLTQNSDPATARMGLNLFSSLTEALPLLWLDEAGNVVEGNAALCELLRCKRESLIGVKLPLFHSGAQQTNSWPDIRRAVKEEGFWKGELWSREADGRRLCCDARVMSASEGSENNEAYLAVLQDTSMLKLRIRSLEKLLLRKSEELTNLLDRIGDGFLALDRDFRYTYANKRIGEMTGRLPASLIGNNIWEEFPEAVGSETYQAFMKAWLDKKPIANTDYYEPLDLWQENYIYPTEDGLTVLIRDVTARKKAELKQLQNEQIYRNICSQIPGSAIFLFDKELRYLLVEGDLPKKLGFPKDQLLNRKLQEVLPEEKTKRFLPHILRAFEGKSSTLEASSRGYDLISRFVPLRNEKDEVYAVMAVGIDVSKLKAAQRKIEEQNNTLEEKVKERTEQLERLNRELESFSYSVAHDLRTPLRALSGYSVMLMEEQQNNLAGEGRRHLKEIDHNAKKMGQLIDDLLNFSRLGRKDMHKKEVDMRDLVNTCLLELRQIYPSWPAVVLHELPPVNGDPSLLKHVLINLISNAIKYSSHNTLARVEIGSKEEKARTVFWVKDNGVGFDMTYQFKLFGVFQRLHSEEEFEGSGVGLAIVQRIIERHGGRVWAEGKAGKGATFSFSLPK